MLLELELELVLWQFETLVSIRNSDILQIVNGPSLCKLHLCFMQIGGGGGGISFHGNIYMSKFNM